MKLFIAAFAILAIVGTSLAFTPKFQTGFCVDLLETDPGGDADQLCDDFVLRTEDITLPNATPVYIPPTGPVEDPSICENKECNTTRKIKTQVP